MCFALSTGQTTTQNYVEEEIKKDQRILCLCRLHQMLRGRLKARTSLSVRGTQPDQMISFMNKDRISHLKMVEHVIDDKRHYCCSTFLYISDSNLHIQSDTYLGGVPRFLIKIEDTMRFTTFHMGKNNFSHLCSCIMVSAWRNS